MNDAQDSSCFFFLACYGLTQTSQRDSRTQRHLTHRRGIAAIQSFPSLTFHDIDMFNYYIKQLFFSFREKLAVFCSTHTHSYALFYRTYFAVDSNNLNI